MKRAGLVLLWTLFFQSAPAVADDVAEALDLGGLEARAAALILSGQEGGELPISVLPVPLNATDNGVRVGLVIDIVLEGTPPPVEDEHPWLTEIYAYALDAQDGVGGYLTQGFTLDEDGLKRAFGRTGIKFFGHLELMPGEYSLRVLVLENQATRMSLRTVKLEVPVPDEERGVIPPPLFPEDPERWVLVREASKDGTDAILRFATGEVPAAWPLVPSAGVASFYLADRPLPDGLEARFLTPDGQEVRRLGLAPPGAASLSWRTTEVGPIGIAAGEYVMSLVTASDNVPVVPATRIAVLPGAEISADTTKLATAALGVDNFARLGIVSTTGIRRETEGVTDTVPVERSPRVAIVGAYGKALRRLVAGERWAAIEAIEKLETEWKDKGPILDKAQMDVAGNIIKTNPDAVIPLLALHEELFRRHHQRENYRLATHARRLVAAYSTLYSQKKGRKRSSEAIAGAMTSVAGYLQGVGSPLAAQQVFEKSLQLAPEHPAALLGMAAFHEAYGSYEDANRLLARLDKVRPDHPEVRLRRAVNRRRMGALKDAEAGLRACLGDQGWTSVVAYQELADFYVSQERYEDAVEVLNEARERHPAQQRFMIQLAAVYDRLPRRQADARRVLAELDDGPGRDADTPRLLYGQWPAWAVDDARRDLLAASEEQLPALGIVLDTLLGKEEAP